MKRLFAILTILLLIATSASAMDMHVFGSQTGSVPLSWLDDNFNMVASPKVDVLYKYGGGTAYTDASIQSAMTALGSINKYTLFLRPGVWTISNSLTITSNYTLELAEGATLSVAGSKTITMPSGSIVKSRWAGGVSASVSAYGSSIIRLDVDRSETISADTTVPATMGMKVYQGAILTIATNKTLTINGPFESGGLYQKFIYSGTGKVLFGTGSITEVYPQWWGALGNGVNDDSLAINYAGASLTGGGTVKLIKGIYYCKHTVIFYPFIHYQGDRAATASNVAPTNTDNHGTVLWQAPDIYTADNNTAGVLSYVSVGDLSIDDIQFMGTGGLNPNPSIGIQFGSSNKSRTHEGAYYIPSGISMRRCRFFGFQTAAMEINNLNDTYFEAVGFESNVVGIQIGNTSAPGNVYCDFTFTNSVFYACPAVFNFIDAPASGTANYVVKINGGSWVVVADTSSERLVNYLVASKAPYIQFLANGLDVQAQKDTTHKVAIYSNGLYDSADQFWSFANCRFDGGLIYVARGSGTAAPSKVSITNCNFLDAELYFNIAQKLTITGNDLDNTPIVVGSSTGTSDVILSSNRLMNNSGTALTIGAASSGNWNIANNNFTSVTTPVSVVDNSTNDTIVWTNNIGLTNIPIRGRVLSTAPFTYSQLTTTPPNTNGSIVYCSDCTYANPVASGGSGAFARRINGVWVGN